MRQSICGARRAFPHRTLTLLAFAAGLLLAQSGTVSAQGGKTLSVRAEGFGTIIDGDVAQAKSRAEADARVRALQKAVGVYVEAETLVQNEILLDTAVRDKTAGFIQNYRVLSEGKANAGTYRVETKMLALRRDRADPSGTFRSGPDPGSDRPGGERDGSARLGRLAGTVYPGCRHRLLRKRWGKRRAR